MRDQIFLPAGNTEALRHAANYLCRQGWDLATQPVDAVTHLLLPVPSFEPDGSLKGGGDLKAILSRLSSDVMIFGGFLNHPLLEGYQTVDFLQDDLYLAENANITAHCALELAMAELPVTLQDLPVLVIGWGRIGKCLAALLKALGAKVSVAARKEADRAMLAALGYTALSTDILDPTAYRVIFNTVPVLLLPGCPGDALKIDLASKPGITGPQVIWARGLPNKDAPESSGQLIGRTAVRFAAEKEGAK